MSSRKVKSKTTKKTMRSTTRRTSNVFAQFEPEQTEEFRQIFNMVDQDKDGLINGEDLKDMWGACGKEVSDAEVQEMLCGRESINLTQFLGMMAEKLFGTDPEGVIMNAFVCLDHKNLGYLDANQFKEMLTTMGDVMSPEDVDLVFKDARIKDGKFDYKEFTKMIKHGKKEQNQ